MEVEPSPRWGQVCAAIEEKLLVWGGRTKGFFEEKKELASSIYSFDPLLEFWTENKCSGDSPPGLYIIGASVSAGHHLYVYGGNDGHFQSSLHQLDTTTWTWQSLPAGHTKKVGCGMVQYNNKLVLFGGYGFLSDSTQPGVEFIKNTNSSSGMGWTNELHTFDLKEGVWSSPTVSGTRLPPYSHFSLTIISDNQAVLFGGLQAPGPVVTNDVYILDMARMHWRKLDHHEGDPWPVRRDRHAAVCLGYGGDHPQLFVTGGLDSGNKVLSDAWLLDVQSGRWREVSVWKVLSNIENGLHAGCPKLVTSGLTLTTLYLTPHWLGSYRLG